MSKRLEPVHVAFLAGVLGGGLGGAAIGLLFGGSQAPVAGSVAAVGSASVEQELALAERISEQLDALIAALPTLAIPSVASAPVERTAAAPAGAAGFDADLQARLVAALESLARQPAPTTAGGSNVPFGDRSSLSAIPPQLAAGTATPDDTLAVRDDLLDRVMLWSRADVLRNWGRPNRARSDDGALSWTYLLEGDTSWHIKLVFHDGLVDDVVVYTY